jgi:hypothetical protein
MMLLLIDGIHFQSWHRMAGAWARTGTADPSVMGGPKKNATGMGL